MPAITIVAIKEEVAIAIPIRVVGASYKTNLLYGKMIAKKKPKITMIRSAHRSVSRMGLN